MKQYEIDMLVKKITLEMNHKTAKGEYHSKSVREKKPEAKLTGVSVGMMKEREIRFVLSREEIL